MNKIIAIDTEFNRTHTYRPILSIIQIKINDEEPIIYDVYGKKNENLKDLIEILSDKNAIKIIHSAHNDIEAIFCRFNIIINNVFDTQIGYKIIKNDKSEISYSSLVEYFCEKKIIKNKLLQKSNWLKRPLTNEQIIYAKQDVIYLHDIYNKMMSFFKENKEKYAQFSNECLLLENKEKYEFNPIKVWQKIKHKYINDIDYKLIEKLIFSREILAYKANIPREFAIKTKYLIDFAKTGDKEILLNNIHRKIDSNTFINIYKKYK